MAPFVEARGQILALSPLKLDFRIERHYKPLSDEELGEVFGQDDASDIRSLLADPSGDSLIDEHEQNCFESSDEIALASEPSSGTAQRLSVLQSIGRIALGLVLTAGTVYLGVAVYLYGAASLLSSFQSVGWFWQFLMFSVGFYLVSLPFGWGYIVLNLLGYVLGFLRMRVRIYDVNYIGVSCASADAHVYVKLRMDQRVVTLRSRVLMFVARIYVFCWRTFIPCGRMYAMIISISAACCSTCHSCP